MLRYFQVAALPVRLCRLVAVHYTPTGALSADTPQAQYVLPNVRAKRATTVGRQARGGENVRITTGPGLVACRWRSA